MVNRISGEHISQLTKAAVDIISDGDSVTEQVYELMALCTCYLSLLGDIPEEEFLKHMAMFRNMMTDVMAASQTGQVDESKIYEAGDDNETVGTIRIESNAKKVH